MQPLRFMLLMAKTGGGHGAVAEAVAQALVHQYGQAVEAQVVDGLRGFAPFPFSRLIDSTYSLQVKLGGDGYGAAWRALNDANRAKALMRSTWPLVRSAALKIVEQPVDAIVSGQRRAVEPGVRRKRIGVPALPIRLEFAGPLEPRPAVRARLGLQPEKPTVLLMGGGEGMGHLGEIVRAVGFSGLDIQMIVVAGRNKKLEQHLNEVDWPIPVRIYGFTQDIPVLMNAADVLVSKAGPTTVAEALARDLPTILSGFIPSQEEENVTYMIETGAGVLAERPDRIIAILNHWVSNGGGILSQMSAAARGASAPRARTDPAR